MSDEQTRQGPDHRRRRRRPDGSDLCRPRQSGAGRHPGPAAGRPDDHHHRRRELSGLRRGHPGPLADGADGAAGRALRRRAAVRPRHRRRPVGPPVPGPARRRRHLHRRRPDRRHRCPGALAGAGQRAALLRRRRLGLRHLRRVLLPRQARGHRRRRQHGGRGGALPGADVREGDADPSPRQPARREGDAAAPVRASRRSRSSGTMSSTRCWAPRTRRP